MERSPGSAAKVRLRAYRPEDFAAVRTIWRSAGLRLGPTDTFTELERARRRDPGLFLVALAGRHAVGAVFGRFDGHRGWVHHLAVHPRWQHSGVGRRLMDEVERRLLRLGCPKLNLHVEPSNGRVVAFYRSMGFGLRDMLFLEKWLGAFAPVAGKPPRAAAIRPRRRTEALRRRAEATSRLRRRRRR
jgi:ribosomal protein S18 acetylase RimI-like enzyme